MVGRVTPTPLSLHPYGSVTAVCSVDDEDILVSKKVLLESDIVKNHSCGVLLRTTRNRPCFFTQYRYTRQIKRLALRNRHLPTTTTYHGVQYTSQVMSRVRPPIIYIDDPLPEDPLRKHNPEDDEPVSDISPRNEQQSI